MKEEEEDKAMDIDHQERDIIQQQYGIFKGEVKKKIEKFDSRSRRVLGDIGNLVNVPPVIVDGKPQNAYINRPITRAYSAQLVGNATQAATVNKKSNSDAEDCLKRGLEPKVKRIAIEEDVVGKNKIVDGWKKREWSRKENVRSLTSVLTARSKAACVIMNKPNEMIENIDEADANNELAEVEYVEDIYKYYKHTEEDSRVHDYMGGQPEINSKMRSILVDWLIEVHRKFELIPETLYLTVNIMDRFLSRKRVARRALQLVGISSMLIACKYEEIWAPEVNDFVCISDNAYTREHILLMEKTILGLLEWVLTVPTPYAFLVRYIKASSSQDTEMENLVFYLAELGMMDYKVVVKYNPSVIAASAVCAARHGLGKSPLWTETLKYHTGYCESELKDCTNLLLNFWLGANRSSLQASHRKFLNPDRGAVAFLPTPRKPLGC